MCPPSHSSLLPFDISFPLHTVVCSLAGMSLLGRPTLLLLLPLITRVPQPGGSAWAKQADQGKEGWDQQVLRASGRAGRGVGFWGFTDTMKTDRKQLMSLQHSQQDDCKCDGKTGLQLFWASSGHMINNRTQINICWREYLLGG